MKSTVSVLPCPDYTPENLDRKIAQSAEAAGMPDVKGACILVKPNLLNASEPEKAVTTHPEFLFAVLRHLKNAGAGRIMVGDSPAWQSQQSVGKKTGIRAVADAAGVEWADFSEGEDYECAAGRVVKKFVLAKPFGEADLVFNLPKLKTHMLTYYTGAIKNLFGLVPGFAKSAFHMRFPGRTEFGAMLVDLAMTVRPDFTFMDAIVGMEGPGPNNGRPKHIDRILASRDPLALDRIAARIIGYDPDSIAYLADASARGIWVSGDRDIELSGLSMDEAKVASFDLVKIARDGTPFSKILPKGVHSLLRDLTVARPVFDYDACRLCSGCIDICPAKALSFSPELAGKKKFVRIDYDKCIRCYCCHEVCPANAIRLAKGPRMGSGKSHQ